MEKKWIVYNRKNIAEWLDKINKKSRLIKKEHPVISQFRNLIMENPIIRMYMTEMIQQIPKGKLYDKHRPQNINHLLKSLNTVLTLAPEYNDTMLVGTPFSAILIWTMGTPAGFCAYRNEQINHMFKKLLKVWCKFLNS